MKTNAQNIKTILILMLSLTIVNFTFSQDKSDWEDNYPDGCTSITVGKKATSDGSVITSHTCDSHRTRSWINIIPAKDHKKGDMAKMVKKSGLRYFCNANLSA